jgi:hypothetical protein
MQIGALSVPASSSTQWSSPQPQSRSAAASFAVADLQIAAPAAARSPEPAAAAPSSAQVQSSASTVDTAKIATTYSTTVAGKSYAASVEESGGVYTASVPMPPGLRATGSSIESAEINLSIVLDALA